MLPSQSSTSRTQLSSLTVLGSINVDLVVQGARLPGPGETVTGGRFYRANGGKGANQAVAAARAGQDTVSFIAAVGDDDVGRDVLAELGRENLDLQFVKKCAGQSTGIAIIMVDGQGENAISVASGANSQLSVADLSRLPDELFKSPRVFLTCLESPHDTVFAGLKRARLNGAMTILNPAPADSLVDGPLLLKDVDVLTPNAAEASQLTGELISDADSAAKAARIFQKAGCKSVIITLGAAGCVIVDGDTVGYVKAVSVDTVDTTAAGDAFNGALAIALCEGHSLTESAQFANMAAAIAVTRSGAQPSLPSRGEIDAFV